jgi:hypothetical protein
MSKKQGSRTQSVSRPAWEWKKVPRAGGVVKVEIYEVDTKIELKVNMFLLGLWGRKWAMSSMSTRLDYIIYVDMKKVRNYT